MKNVLLIWNGLLTVGIIVLWASLNQKVDKSGDVAAGSSAALTPDSVKLLKPLDLPKVTADGKKPTIYYVNTDTLIAKYKVFTKESAVLESRTAKLEATIVSRRRALEQEVMSAQQRMQSGAMTQTQAQETEANLVRKQQELAAYADGEQEKIINEQKRITEKLQKNVQGYLKTYCAKAGIEYVLSYSNSGSILFANPSLDITEQVLEGLNSSK